MDGPERLPRSCGLEQMEGVCTGVGSPLSPEQTVGLWLGLPRLYAGGLQGASCPASQDFELLPGPMSQELG